MLFDVIPLLPLYLFICIFICLFLFWLMHVLTCFVLDLSLWDTLGFFTLYVYSLSHFREVFNYFLLKYFVMPFPFVFFLRETYDLKCGTFNIVPEASEAVFISLFFFFPVLLHLFPTFYLPAHLVFLLPQLLYCFCCTEWFLSQLLHWSLVIDYSLLLLGPFKTLLSSSQYMSKVYLSVTPFMSKTLTIIMLNCFSCRLLTSSSFIDLLIFIVFLHLLDMSLSFHVV